MAKYNSMELGIQTAQALMNEKKHDELRQKLQKQYPLIPPSVLDAAIDVIASGFQQVAPDSLKKALTPGGMEDFRPVIRKSILDVAKTQKVIKDIPILSQKEKMQLVEYLVDLALDQVIGDADYILSAPEVRLEALEAEIRQIKSTEMTRKQRILYRYRQQPVRYTVGMIVASFYAYARFAHSGSWEAAAKALVAGVVVAGRAAADGVATFWDVASRYSVKFWKASSKNIPKYWARASKKILNR